MKIGAHRIINFILVWIFTIVFGLIGIWATDVFFGIEEPMFYSIAVAGLVFGSFVFALSTSLKK